MLAVLACLRSAFAAEAPVLERAGTRDTELRAQAALAIVGIECRLGEKRERFYGSGLVLSDTGLILTSSTAVPAGAREIQIQFATGEGLKANEVDRAEACEAVLLQAQGKPARERAWVTLAAGHDRKARPGDRVYAAGNAYQTLGRDGELYWSPGTLASRRSLHSDDACSRYQGPAFETAAAVNYGCDGGALLDAQGRLLGMLSLSYERGRWLGTAIPLSAILAQFPRAAAALQSTGLSTNSHTGGDALARALQQAAQPAYAAVVAIRYRTAAQESSATSATGVLVEPAGTLLTCAGLIPAASTTADVLLADGRRFTAALRGRHLGLDVAVLQLRLPADAQLPALRLPELSSLQAGDFVAVLGAPTEPEQPAGFATGIVSALGRLEGQAVQTDARINFGNAGGPVLGLDGALLGIAAQIDDRKLWAQSSGVGFFAPAHLIRAALPELLAGQVLRPAPQPFLGVRPAVGETDLAGVKLAEVVERSAAWRAGLRAGDVLTALDADATYSWPAMLSVLKKKNAGEGVWVHFVRNDKPGKVRVTLDTRAAE